VTSVIAGFDAGQTHTTCRLAQRTASGELEPVAEGQGPGVSHLAAPGGEGRFSAALRLSMAAATSSMGCAEVELLSAAVGASGIEAGSPVQEQGQQLAATALALPTERVTVTGDERTALRGAFPSGAGILVISGTGCIAVGRDCAGREHRCGGWGWLLDGSGSAMDIGRDALMASVRMADGREGDTTLRHSLWSALAVDSAQDLKALVVGADFGPAGFARLAPCVDQLAETGQAEAMAIIDRSAAGLADLVAGVAQALDLPSPEVAAVGGAITHLGTLRRAWRQELVARLPGATLVAPKRDACHGALLLALELIPMGR
jgi:N-acetylglucosamine kinase-like BadF-type ATPase